MTDTLTDLKIRKIRPPENGRLEIADRRLAGLSLRVTRNGVKTFALRTRVNGRLVRVTLGRYPELSLAEARAKAHEAIAKARAGIEIGGGRRSSEGFAFDAVVRNYIDQQCRRFMKERSCREAERVLSVEFIANWRNRDVRKVTKQDVIAVVNEIFTRPQLDAKKRTVRTERPSAANHAFGHVRAFFNWCVGQGKIEISPCVGLRSPAPKKKRDRVLADDELAAIWRAAESLGYPYGGIVRLLITTVQRRSEVAGLRWEMLDWTERLWRVPGAENKSGREYVVPLSDFALSIIKGVPRIDQRLLFPAQRSDGKVFADWSKSKRRLDELSGVMDWTIHDLRRTGSTNLAKLGVAPHVKERVLNHLTGELGGVAGVYDIYSYLPEKRAALDLWAERIAEITDTGHERRWDIGMKPW